MNFGESASSDKKSNELIKKKDPIRSGILWWASQNFTCQEMLEKWYAKWDDPRTSSTNYRHILYYLSRNSRHDMLDILITRDPKINLKVSYDGELLPLNAAVWTKKTEHIEIIKTINILLTKYKLQIFATANDTNFSNETIFEALFSTDNPILPVVRKQVWEWLVNLPEEFFPFQEFLNKITEKTFEKLQPKLIFMLHRKYIFISNNQESITIIKQLFRQFMSIKLPKIEYNNFIGIMIRLLFPSEYVPSLHLYLPVINLLESRDFIIKNIIDNIDTLVNQEFNDSYQKDNSLIENDYKILSYRVFFAVLGDCYKIGIMKDYIIRYILSNINSKNEFVKLWINRAIVHFLIQSEFNIKTSDPNEKSFISICIKKCLIGKSTKDKTEFCSAFKILLKSKTMPSEEDILKLFNDKENTSDFNNSLLKKNIQQEKNEDYDIIKVIDDTIIITNITSRINKTHKDDFENYKDDFKEILKKSTISDTEKCVAILNGLYDINLKTCTLIKELVIFLEDNIDSFRLLFQTIIIDKMDEIEDIEIDNPLIIDLIKLFI
jgi:hypothetical protein